MNTLNEDEAFLEPDAEDLIPTIGGPNLAACDVDAAVSLTGTAPTTWREQAACSVEERAMVVAVDLETNAIYTCRALPPAPDRGWMLHEYEEQVEDPGPGLAISAFSLDVFDDLALPRWPATYAIYLLIGGRSSAPHRLRVGFSERMHDAATTWQVQDLQRRMHALPVWPDAGTHAAYANDVDIAPLETPGIKVQTEPLLVTGPRRRAVVEGAFLVPLQPQDRVRIRQGERLAILRKSLGPKAVVPINLLVMPDDRPSAFQLPLAVPADTLVTVDERPHATGRFAMNLLAFDAMWTTPQPLHLHAFSSDIASAPTTVRVLPESMLPRRTPPSRPKLRGRR